MPPVSFSSENRVSKQTPCRRNYLVSPTLGPAFPELHPAVPYMHAAPSMPRTLPLIHSPSCEARKQTTRAMSMGSPTRCSGDQPAANWREECQRPEAGFWGGGQGQRTSSTPSSSSSVPLGMYSRHTSRYMSLRAHAGQRNNSHDGVEIMMRGVDPAHGRAQEGSTHVLMPPGATALTVIFLSPKSGSPISQPPVRESGGGGGGAAPLNVPMAMHRTKVSMVPLLPE